MAGADSENPGLTGTTPLLVSGAVTAAEVADRYLAAIDQRNPQLNCFLHVDPDGARGAAAAADERRRRGDVRGPLDGVPVAVKDNIAVAGWPNTAGLAWRAGQQAAADAAIVTRLRDAGAVLLGSTNLDEAALGASTNNPHFGACHNPLRPGFTAGGSSGGSACAVRAGLAPWALGSDTMGSVRIPASYCGVVGFKPGHGVLSLQGVVPLLADFDHLGFLTPSTADLEILLAELGERPAARAAVPQRLGVLRLSDRVEVVPEVASAFEQALDAIDAAGYELLELDGEDYQPGPTRRAGFVLAERALADWLARQGRGVADLSPELAPVVRFGAEQPAAKVERARARIAATRQQLEQWFARCDALLSPTTPQCAFPLDERAPDSQADFTVLANVGGSPAISLPLAHSADSLPAGLQLMMPAGEDRSLVVLAQRIEAICGGNDRGG